MDGKQITLFLSIDEGLVLFEFLSRYEETEILVIDDQSEERVLWNICAELEKQLVAPFASDYRQKLEESRSKVRDNAASKD